MSSELTLEMTDIEAKNLWRYLSGTDDNLNLALSSVQKKLEAMLWDRLSIEEMALAGASSGVSDG